MRLLNLLLLLTLLFSSIEAQKKKKREKYPEATSAEARWEGYQKKLELEKNSLVKEIPFRNVGPTIMSGRVSDLAVDPDDPTHFYVAYASGSLWETTNNGASFTPIFDNEIVMSIGDIAVDWQNDIIYIGTGENNSSRSSYSGFGIFSSADNGKNWAHLGLEETQHIGRILLHPTKPNTIWVAALGRLYSENAERGIYKSTDGGVNWEKTLFVNERSGIIDLIMHESNPDILVAAAWEKDRKAWNFEESGPGTAIYRSEDGGSNWTEIADDSGFPDTNGTGRIGLAFAPSNPSIIYAVLDNQDRREEKKEENSMTVTKDLLRSMTSETFLSLENKDINAFLDDQNFGSQFNAVDLKEEVKSGKISPLDLVKYVEDANSLLFDTPIKGGEMYKSTDAGKTWVKTHEDYIESMIFTYGYYFGQVRVDAQNPDIVYTMGVPLVRSEDGGKTWKSISKENVHSDHHALWVNPKNGNHLINGNDGGINITYDAGETWIKCNAPSVGQFYSVNVDMAEPYNVYGGLQDNGVWKGPSNYTFSNNWHSDGRYPYERLMGGDGMQVAIDTRENQIVYTGYQFGNYFRINTANGKRKYITPKHELGDAPFRWNWESPIILSQHNQDIVYFGSNRFHRSMNQGDTFEALSKDLTNGGRKGDVSFGTLTSISESPSRFGLIYVGSDDGVIHVTKDGGESWTKISDNLPQNFWVGNVEASNHKESRVYASLNGYRWDNFDAMIYVSEDYGANWKSLSSDLPKESVNVIKEDPKNENLLYVGTDHGAYVSLDRGMTFHALKEGLPNVPVHDMVIHPRDNDLVLGTHGRSIYIASVENLQQMDNELMAKGLHAFDVDPIMFNAKWGSKWWTWGEEINPEITIGFYSKFNGKGKIELIYNEEVILSKNVSIGIGLNYEDVALETEASFQNLIPEEQKDQYKAGENGKFYLVAGDYQLKITAGSTSSSIDFKIKKGKERPGRKE